ncbi:putative Ubiquitin-conjugating enzyme [Taphrina deformans PYCC 5710]|uniref:Ubiquitin-conjugating enzyme n=1 Tax=Taphrina deformans (strain PYCC 5710 / ATCC 11124 / CBS 356.35 / IMI 108563 / JCM 9778 / NBRC 8474) TaxID=1097556 RepID=R4XBH2_TAPDE|nr:putative Ubiquitin-conjugating enzyme [Taphrina deformans PYCC 5710]|eukprot:CCG81721.1 putative Ubiquitin-conjugating enzyme [Taphrina deformans PYCC 5710]
MNKNTRKSKVYLEDTVRRPKDNVIGVITRTWHDIEQPEDAEELSPGYFEVNWLDDFGAYAERRLAGNDTTVIHEDSTDDYLLVDRSFGLGDAVKRDSASAMSGIVQSGTSELQIRNLATREVRTCLSNEVVVEAERFQVGDYIVCEETQWVGIIKKLERRTLVKFYSGELAFCNEFEIIPSQYEEGNIFYPDLLPGTTIVQISKTGLKHAEYLTGKYSKAMSRTGVVCTSFTSRVVVDWQFQNMMVSSFVARQAPPIDFSLHVDSRPEDSVYRVARLMDGAFTHQVGDVVRIVGEAPYTRSFQEFVNATLEDGKRNCKDWEVVSTKQQTRIKWQDGSVTQCKATDLVPYLNVDDLDLWPSDHVVSKSNGKTGIVQTCNAEDRTATVLWDGEQTVHEESLYDLMNNGDFNIDLGDLVLIVPADGQVSEQVAGPQSWGPAAIISSISSTVARYISTRSTQAESIHATSDRDSIDWFGQLTAVQEDGTCEVDLCFNRDLQTIHVPTTRLVHVASTGDGDEAGDSDSMTTDSDLEVDSTDSESDAYSVDASEMDDDTNAPWTDENGLEVPVEEEGDWEDDDVDMEDDESDAEVIDIVSQEISAPDTEDIVLSVETDDVEHNDQNFVNTKDLVKPGARSHQDSNMTESEHTRVDRNSEVADAAKPVVLRAEFFPASKEDFASFTVLELEPTDHAFVNELLNRRSQALKRIAHEYKALATSLPPGILVRSFESRMDLLRVVILGPSGTPYEYAPMLFDFYIPPEYPQEPPVVHFHSWTNGIGKINPNLYEEGKVCLSLLGTWHGNEMSETWTTNSSLLQIFVSLQALVLVKEPYYNEAGYDVLSAQDTAVAAANYSERAFVLTRGFISHALRNPIQGLEREIEWLYRGSPQFLSLAVTQAEAIASQSEQTRDVNQLTIGTISKISKGALLLLKRILNDLHSI